MFLLIKYYLYSNIYKFSQTKLYSVLDQNLSIESMKSKSI